jgi:hypothetical protein
MDKWTIEGCTKAVVQGQPHLTRSSRTTASSGHNLARLGRTAASRSWPQPATVGQSRPQLATAGHTWPGLGPDAPLGAPAPTKGHVSGPRHQKSHEQVLDWQETLILC